MRHKKCQICKMRFLCLLLFQLGCNPPTNLGTTNTEIVDVPTVVIRLSDGDNGNLPNAAVELDVHNQTKERLFYSWIGSPGAECSFVVKDDANNQIEPTELLQRLRSAPLQLTSAILDTRESLNEVIPICDWFPLRAGKVYHMKVGWNFWNPITQFHGVAYSNEIVFAIPRNTLKGTALENETNGK